MKTKFEELWSRINFTDNYDNSEIRFWYLNDGRLDPLTINEIIKIEDGMIQIVKNQDDQFITEIPIYRIYVITHGKEFLMDRRIGNPQAERLDIYF